MGYGQGPGQANNIGSMYETLGFAGGRSFGLSIAAAGYLSACIVGIIFLNILVKKGKVKIKSYEEVSGSLTVDAFQDKNEIPIAESIDRLSMQFAFVLVVYLLTYLATVSYTHLQTVAAASGIDVDRTRVIAMVLSTVLACWGQLIYLQNIGTFSTYGAHLQIGQFAVAALLVGGASVSKATNKQALIGVTLFHLLFIIAPQAGRELFGDAMVGEYFRVFVSYGVIALSLAMHAWQRKIRKEDPEFPDEVPSKPATALAHKVKEAD